MTSKQALHEIALAIWPYDGDANKHPTLSREDSIAVAMMWLYELHDIDHTLECVWATR